MRLMYTVKIEYQDGLIIGLIAPDLRTDFINSYIDLANQDLSIDQSLSVKHLKIDSLKIVMENYIRFLQNNNHIIRIPCQSRMKDFQSGEHWVNIELSIQIEEGTFERLGKIVSISLLVAFSVLFEFLYILASRLNNVSYISLVLPVLADLIMGGIVYIYSGSASNIADKGREFDDWLYKTPSSTEIEFDKGSHIFSSLNMARFLLCIPSLTHAVLRSVGYWQSMISMGNELEESNSSDTVLSSKFIYNSAVVGSIIVGIYNAITYTSFSLKATNTLKALLDRSYDVCRKKEISVLNRNSFEMVSADEETESDDSATVILDSTCNILKQTDKDNKDIIMFSITDVIYDNLLLNVQGILFEADQIGGTRAVQNIINLGEDYEVASTIAEYIKQYGIKHVMKILFSDTINDKVDLSCNQIVAIAEDKVTKKYSETLVLLDVEKVASKIIEQNFFLNSEQGRVFVQSVANNFDNEALLKILELGKDKEIAEQILIETETQDINRVVFTLLGKELRISDTANSLENIIGTQELSQLQLVSNGVFNGWSNQAYQKVVGYIDNLAKNLDDLLNTGKSGSQVAVTLALLEEWLGFAASGQRFIGGRPYYNPDDNDDDWLYGDGGSSDGNNNSSGNFDNQNGFGLILPSYNGTDYNITDYQM